MFESSDARFSAQLLVFVGNGFLCDIKEECLLCTQLETSTRAARVKGNLSSFIKADRIPEGKCCRVCTDEAPSMPGSKSGFQRRVKEVAPTVK